MPPDLKFNFAFLFVNFGFSNIVQTKIIQIDCIAIFEICGYMLDIYALNTCLPQG